MLQQMAQSSDAVDGSGIGHSNLAVPQDEIIMEE